MTEDVGLTMEEFIDLQQEAIQKYPWKFDKCFFTQGSVKQPLFICHDCCKTSPSAICYSCSISCHSGHQITEIGMKRNYQCECGTSAYSSSCILYDKCTCTSAVENLDPDSKSDSTNSLPSNDYSLFPNAMHNFNGKFCYCDSEYDEYTSDNESFMLQCRLCEDWFHSKCIAAYPGNDDLFCEFFCKTCKDRSMFLSSNAKLLSFTNTNPTTITFGCNSTASESILQTQSIESSSRNELYCNKWWVENVCKCKVCIDNIENDIMRVILIDEEMEWTPEVENENGEKEYEESLESLKSIDRNVALEGIYACRTFSDSLKEFLAPFAKQQKVVTKDDIEDFMQAFKSQSARHE